MPDHPAVSTAPDAALDTLAVNTIRFLSADAVEAANSGHPGLPMGAAPMAYTLWTRHLRHNPGDEFWLNRDRFVLSAGHGSMLLYSLLHLTGYALSIDDLKAFRQLNSKTPGHPEFHSTPGVETTTGPLGQGFAMSVGLAMAESHLAARLNTAEHALIDHFTYVIVSDGDLMEGISHEAASLAGHLGLGKLVVLYDDNHISIDGPTDLSFTEDVAARFSAYGWHVQRVGDGNDVEAIDAAIHAARAETTRPSIIAVRTIIGYGAPTRQGTQKAHGEPLGAAELRAAKEALGWPTPGESFVVPDAVRAHMRGAVTAGKAQQATWQALREAWEAASPDAARDLEMALDRSLPDGWLDILPVFAAGEKLATRAASGKVLGALTARLPWIVGGSADLTPSNNTHVAGMTDYQAATPEGGYFRFGVREHGMAAAMNGLSLHGGLRPYGGTFLVFADYLRPALRLSAIMDQPVVYVFTHDSIGLGEDGPTHQPIAQLASLRAIPNVTVVRPCDANETAMAWRLALEQTDRPTCLALTRQGLPTLDRTTHGAADGLLKGAYVLREETGTLGVILIATGSEVHVALDAADILAKDGVGVRVVSMPAMDVFERQTTAYRASVLPPKVRARVAVEAAATFGWERYVGLDGEVVGMTGFGASGKAEDLFEFFGFTGENVAEAARRSMAAVAAG